jgi:endonuclease YncB( thermonuclease family)
MEWTWRAGLVGAAGMALAACGPDLALDALESAGTGRVVGVPAGDALDLADGRRVRLAGIEAPHGEAPYAAEARTALARLALGREVELLQGGAGDDGYGRVVAQVRETGRRLWLEGALVEAGAARVRTYRDNRAMARAMLAREAKARIEGRGLWRLPAYRVLLPAEARGRSGLVVVEGRVVRAQARAGGVELRLAESGPSLAVTMPARAWSDFDAAGRDPRTLVGRLVRVRGAAAGAGLRLDHPEQLELLAEPRR